MPEHDPSSEEQVGQKREEQQALNSRFFKDPPVPKSWRPPPKRIILMGPLIVSLGAMAVFFLVVGFVVVLPLTTFEPPPSDNAVKLSQAAWRGKQVFQANGCNLCHSNFSRPQDYVVGQYYTYSRASEAGDWPGAEWTPNLFGSIRTGPDLSQEGGQHPDDWHYVHFWNARYANPVSIMPQFSFLTENEVSDLIAFMQEVGGKEANARRLHQANMKALLVATGNIPDVPGVSAADAGAISNMMYIERGYWLHENPLPVNEQNLLRGKVIFQKNCVGCHGVSGNGNGPAARFSNPPPAPFNDSGDAVGGTDTSPGVYYARILRGIPGALMENFGQRFSVEDIWRVTMFVKSVPNGSLQDPLSIPTVEQYVQWQGPSGVYEWAENFYPLKDMPKYDALFVGGPVAGMVKEGTLSPGYAVDLWMLEHPNLIPGAGRAKATNLDAVMRYAREQQAARPGWAVQGVDQRPFIPKKFLNPATIAPATLANVWKPRSAQKTTQD